VMMSFTHQRPWWNKAPVRLGWPKWLYLHMQARLRRWWCREEQCRAVGALWRAMVRWCGS
jgi:hypothetical protein